MAANFLASIETGLFWQVSKRAKKMLKIAINCTWLSEVEEAANRMAANLLVSIETGLFDIRSLLASSCWVILITFWLNWALFSTGSTAGIPMRFSKSQRRADLIFMSIGVSQFRDGLRLTSKSQGFKSESIKISKPEIKEKMMLFVTLKLKGGCLSYIVTLIWTMKRHFTKFLLSFLLCFSVFP